MQQDALPEKDDIVSDNNHYVVEKMGKVALADTPATHPLLPILDA